MGLSVINRIDPDAPMASLSGSIGPVTAAPFIFIGVDIPASADPNAVFPAPDLMIGIA